MKTTPQMKLYPNLTGRALAAYYRSGGTGQPTAKETVHNELLYVRLVLGGDTIAVYRVRAYDGILKRLKRWPADLQS